MPDSTQARIVRVEATLLRVPVFALAVKGAASLDGFESRRVSRRGDRTVEVVIRTERDDRSAYPGPLSRRAHFALLSMISDRGFPFENPLSWTWRDLCRTMGLPASGRRDRELKAALRSTWGLKIFGLSSREGRERETWRRLYADLEFLNETRQDGTTATANRLWLAPWYVESLNAFHAAPIDYDLWRTLDAIGPLASRLYEYLVPSFYKRDAMEVAYDRLAASMPVVAESRRSHAVRQFAPALAAAEAEGLISGYEWSAMKGTGRPKLVLSRGPRLAPPGAVASSGEPAPEAAKAGVPEAFDATSAKRLAAEFYRLMGKPDTSPLRSDLAVSGSLLARFGADRAASLLPVGVRLLKARFRNAETMGALVRYVDEAARDQEKRDAETRRDADHRQEKATAEEVSASEDARARAVWEARPEPEKDEIRARVLAEHPGWRKRPALVEAHCVAISAEQGGGR